MQKSINPWMRSKRQMMSLAAVAFAMIMISGQAEGQSKAQLPPHADSAPQALEATQPESLPIPAQPQPPAVEGVDDRPAATGYPADGADCECGPVCVYNPCIKYRGEHRLKRICRGCKCPTFEKVLMTVEDPARCGCAVEIPICVPTCVQGEPCVEGRCGVAGRGVVWLKWCCGYKVRVLFAGNNECKGRNVIVSYFGK